MENIKQKLIESGFKGEMDDSISTLQFYSHDASLFEIMPKIVLFPKDNKDVITIVKVVAGEKKMNPKLSITARSAGTCMSGGAVNDSIIVDFTKHINQFEGIKGDEARVMPGMFYRDFEKETLKKNLLMPSYPASRDLSAVVDNLIRFNRFYLFYSVLLLNFHSLLGNIVYSPISMLFFQV